MAITFSYQNIKMPILCDFTMMNLKQGRKKSNKGGVLEWRGQGIQNNTFIY